MIDFLQTAFIFLVLMFMAYGCWVSTVMLSERSRLRKITGQYYDYEIEQELKKMGLTREEALEEFDE
jgi:hypothetical protein